MLDKKTIYVIIFTALVLSNVLSQTDRYGNLTGNSVLGGLGASSKYVQVPFDSSFNSPVNGTVEMWVNPTNLTHENTLISKTSYSSAVSFILKANQSSGLIFQIGSVTFIPSSVINIPLNKWSHVAVTWSGGQSAYIVNYYLNGLLIGTVGPNSAVWDTGINPVIIGGNLSTQQNFFEGKIDEVRFWRVEKSEFQIALSRFTGLGDDQGANANNALTSSSVYNGLVSSWSFNSSVYAYDYIGGKNGSYIGGAQPVPVLAGQPIPYNMCLKTNGFTNDYMTIPHNPAFNLTTRGTFEAWVSFSALGSIAPIFIKGNSYANTTLGIFLSPGNKLGCNIGAHNYYDSGPITFEINKWYHIAVTWSNGPNFSISFYINGEFQSVSTYAITMPVNTDSAWIGRNYTTSRTNGYFDDIRIWNYNRTFDEIKNTMFVSGNALKNNSSLVACWNFDGNLKNSSQTTGIDGSFLNGSNNNSRISAYFNEGEPGEPGKNFVSFNTTLDAEEFSNFQFRVKRKVCLEPGETLDTLNISNVAGNVNNLQLFLNLQHQRTGDLTLTLIAPNGQSRIFTQNVADSSKSGFFTIFDDNFSESITSQTFMSPWTNYVKPQSTFGNMGSSSANGNWVLKISDANSTNQGVLLGWGLRLNYTVGISYSGTDIPSCFSIKQNYPNPFNPNTNIEFSVPKAGNVSVKLFDVSGKEYKSGINNKNLIPGVYKMNFDGSSLPSGIYFYSLIADDSIVSTKKMVLIK
ncbi:MAG: LamG-like jellyroll fold domain-containing protein [Ignavibacteria bacterium]